MAVRIRSVNNIPRIIGNLRDLDRLGLEIGIFAGENFTEVKDGETPVDYAIIAGVHEHGATIRQSSRTIVIPERSFIRSTFDEKQNEWTNFVKRRVDKVLKGRMGAHQLMDELGAQIVRDIQEKIKQLNDPPNAPSTVAQKKGANNPLIDSGHMRMHVTYKVVSVYA